jgi:hypothetical protein
VVIDKVWPIQSASEKGRHDDERARAITYSHSRAVGTDQDGRDGIH